MINTPFPHSTFSVNNVPPEVSHMLHNCICVSVFFFFFLLLSYRLKACFIRLELLCCVELLQFDVMLAETLCRTCVIWT